MTSSVYAWFISEVYFWRSLASTLWSIICLPVFLFLFLVVSWFSFTHLITWIYDVLDCVFSSQFWITIFLYGVCLVVVTWFSLPHLSVIPEVESTVLSSFLALIRWSRLPLLAICALAGTVSAWSLSGLMGDEFGSLTRVISTETHEIKVLNESHLFIVLGGIFTALSYYRQFFHCGHYYLSFPNLQRFRYFQVRSEVTLLVYTCLWESFHTVKYYYLFYFLFGSFIKRWINTSFNISIDKDATIMTSLIDLLSLSLFWQTILCSYLLKFSWSFARTMVKVFHTQKYEFMIHSVMEYDKQKTLPEAIACSHFPLLQHLAFLDFSLASKFSCARRQELLTLSQPGGHPRIWTSTSSTAVAVIKELTEQVKEENWAIMSKISVGSQRSSNNVYPGTQGSSMTFRGQCTQPSDTQEDQSKDQLLTVLSTTVVSAMSSLPLISYFLSESPDARSKRLFASCQLQIWAIEGLSHMAAKSYTEDKYGIVQTLLPSIFAAFLDIHEAVEKHFKLSSSVFRKPSGSANSAALLRYKFQSVTKAAIYRIVNTYRQHLEDIRLGPEYRKKLQPFVEYNI